jgi:hypothetical protein
LFHFHDASFHYGSVERKRVDNLINGLMTMAIFSKNHNAYTYHR